MALGMHTSFLIHLFPFWRGVGAGELVPSFPLKEVGVVELDPSSPVKEEVVVLLEPLEFWEGVEEVVEVLLVFSFSPQNYC